MAYLGDPRQIKYNMGPIGTGLFNPYIDNDFGSMSGYFSPIIDIGGMAGTSINIGWTSDTIVIKKCIKCGKFRSKDTAKPCKNCGQP